MYLTHASFLTSSCKHASNAIDQTRFVRHEDRNDVLLLTLCQRLCVVHVNIVFLLSMVCLPLRQFP